MKKYLLLALVLVVLASSACSIKKDNRAANNNQENILPDKTEISPVVVSSTPGNIISTTTPTIPNRTVNKSITSDKLGIKVGYYSLNNNIQVQENGNKIYFYNSAYEQDYKSGQSLEVFYKDSKISLKKALENNFLNSTSLDKCFVTIIEDNNEYQKAVIDYPDTPCSDGSPAWACNTCPASYSKSNGMAYFLYYKSHPGIYFYLSIGQYTLVDITSLDSASEEIGHLEWFNNIEFVNK